VPGVQREGFDLMSNTRHLREMNGGRLTRPRDQWAGKRRQAHVIAGRAGDRRQQGRALTLSQLAISQLASMVATARMQGRQGADRRAGS